MRLLRADSIHCKDVVGSASSLVPARCCLLCGNQRTGGRTEPVGVKGGEDRRRRGSRGNEGMKEVTTHCVHPSQGKSYSINLYCERN